MMNLTRFALTHKTLTMASLLMAIVWGIWIFYTAPRSEDPSFVIRTSVVTTEWPGASAAKVEQLLTIPLERSFASVEGVKRIRSESKVGLSVIYIDLEPYITQPNNTWNQIKERTNQFFPFAPPGCAPPYVDTDFGTTSAMILVVYSLYPQKHSEEDLRQCAREIQTELNTIPDLGKLEIIAQSEVINLEIAANVWSKLGIPVEQLRLALESKNIVAPGGSLDTKLARFIVTPSGEFETTKQIENVVLKTSEQNTPLRLQELGIRVNRTYPDPPRSFCRYAEKDLPGITCVLINFAMKKGGNILTLGQEVREKLRKIEEDRLLPPGVRVAVISDQPAHVTDAIDNCLNNLYQEIYLLLIFAILLIDLRSAFIMASSIPIVTIASLGVVRMFGVQLEQVSLAAVIVALGMIVDNGIEVTENAHRHMITGQKSRFDAVWQGASEIALPLLASTLITMSSFLPMLIIPGEEGEYVYSLPVVVSTTLLMSWFTALTVTAIFTFWFVKPSKIHGGLLAFLVRTWIALSAIFARIKTGQGDVLVFAKRLWKWVVWRMPEHDEEEGEGFVQRIYVRLLKVCVQHRFLTIGCILIFCVLSSMLVGAVGSQFFPLAERDQFVIDVWLPEGATIKRTDEVCRQLEDVLFRYSKVGRNGQIIERIKSVTTFVGCGAPRFYVVFDPMPEQPFFGQLLVNTTEPAHTDTLVAEMDKVIDDKVAGARVNVRKLNLGTSTSAPIAIRVVGKDPGELRAIATKIKRYLFLQPNISNIYDDWGSPILQVDTKIDEALANLAGVTNRDVAETTNTFLSGHYLTTFHEGEKSIPVYLRLPKEKRADLSELYNFGIDGPNGRVPLDGIANMEVAWIDSTIIRRNQERTLTVYAFVKGNTLPNDIIQAMLPDLAKMQKEYVKPGYRIEIGGEWEDTIASEKNFEKAFLLPTFRSYLG